MIDGPASPPEPRAPPRRGNETSGGTETSQALRKWKLVGRVTPIVTSAVAAAALLFGVFQYRSESKKDRRAKEVDQRILLQKQIRGDIEELLRFTQDGEQTVSKAAFL